MEPKEMIFLATPRAAGGPVRAIPARDPQARHG